jgi:hypothetical protein
MSVLDGVALASTSLHRRATVHFAVGSGTRCGRGKKRSTIVEDVTCDRCLQGLLTNAHELRRYCESRLRRPTFLDRQGGSDDPQK